MKTNNYFIYLSKELLNYYHMKKNYFLTLIIILISSVTFGQALLSENFNYGSTAGDLTAVSSGGWVNHSGANTVGYAISSLTMASYPSSGIGGSATISPSGSEDVNSVFTEQTSGVVYGGALVNLTALANGNYFLHLKDAASNFRARVGAKDNGAGKILFGIGASSSTLTYGSTAFDLNTTYLLIFTYNIDSGESKLHVLTSVVSTEPGSAETTNTGVSGTGIKSVALRQSSGIPTVTIDGVRVATNWSDIVSEATASINEKTIKGFSSYPNPVNKGRLTVMTSNSNEKEVSIYSILGKRVFAQKFSGNNKQLDVSHINSGIYIMKVIEGDKIVTKKLIIK
jgi:hypothetical protein